MFVAAVAVLLAALASDPCAAFDALYARIRDQRIDRASALGRVLELLPQIRDQFYARGGKDSAESRFPLEGYGPESIGGKDGSGYQPNGYDWFDGRNSKGHPGHDIFIHDRNQDELDDRTGRPVDVLSVAPGIVVAFSPHGIFYYAHARSIAVKPGDIVRAGQVIATVGRSGRNAAAPRSPTHLHVMFLAVGDDGYPRPRDIYRDLITFARK